jgi:chemotaxis protein CheD
MPDVKADMSQVYLQPGDLYVARSPAIIRTILGSCLGATFWSARLGVGGLCHALLPRCPPNTAVPASRAHGYRYVDFCLRDMVRQFDQMGAFRREVEVKLFGGADVLPVGDADARRRSVGKQNCDTAIEILRVEGFQVVASSLGGTLGRNIRFNTETGEVLLRFLSHPLIKEDVDG